MNYNENMALEWMDRVMSMCEWDVAPDCEGSPMQRLQSAYINTQDSYAEGVVSIVDMPAYLRGHEFMDAASLALLPTLPVYD
jgi:hypothetical protein